MHLTIKGYQYELVFSSSVPFSSLLKKHLLMAAQETLASLPEALLKKHLEKKKCHLLNLSVVSSNEIKKLNTQYRGKPKPTDVLSFSRLEGEKSFSIIPDIGDVMICFEVAKKQAKVWENTLPEEIRRLTVHGVLHVFGYDHEISPKEEKRMFSLQEKILRKLHSRIASIGSKRDARTAGKRVAKKIKPVATR